MITSVESQIASMNALITQGLAYIDENYSAIILLPSTRAQGESKVVTHWYGITEVYMISDKAQDLIDSLSAVGDGATTGGLLGFLPGNLGSVLGGIAGIFGVGTLIYRWQVEQATVSATGIIMYIQTVESTQSIYFTSQ